MLQVNSFNGSNVWKKIACSSIFYRFPISNWKWQFVKRLQSFKILKLNWREFSFSEIRLYTHSHRRRAENGNQFIRQNSNSFSNFKIEIWNCGPKWNNSAIHQFFFHWCNATNFISFFLPFKTKLCVQLIFHHVLVFCFSVFRLPNDVYLLVQMSSIILSTKQTNWIISFISLLLFRTRSMLTLPG